MGQVQHREFGERSFASLVQAVDRLPQEIAESVKEAIERWNEGGPLGIMEYEAGRAALIATVLGNAIMEGEQGPQSASKELLQNYARALRQIETAVRLEIEMLKAKNAGNVPQRGPEWMNYAQPQEASSAADSGQPRPTSGGGEADGADE